MDSLRNPYTPNAGAAPEVVVGRDELVSTFEILLARLARGRTEQSMIITGLRGVGKTVALNLFNERAAASRWVVVEFEAVKLDDEHFRGTLFSRLRTALLQISPRQRWTDKARRAASALSSFSISALGVSVQWEADAQEGLADHGNLAMDLTDVLVTLGEAAKEADRGVVILIDEVQFLQRGQLEALIQAIHKTVQRKLPVTFVGAGLPQIPEVAGDAKSYAERLFKFPVIDSLDDDQARLALSGPAGGEGVTFDDDALDLAIEITEGYPYFLQELGYQAWEVAADDVITRADVEDAREAYEAKLDSSFFRVRLDRATPLQTAYMRAMAELGPDPQTARDVARLLARESSQLAPTRAELINMGLLYTPEHGYAAFTVPSFDAFLRRAIPDLEVPPLRGRKRPSQDPHPPKTGD